MRKGGMILHAVTVDLYVGMGRSFGSDPISSETKESDIESKPPPQNDMVSPDHAHGRGREKKRR